MDEYRKAVLSGPPAVLPPPFDANTATEGWPTPSIAMAGRGRRRKLAELAPITVAIVTAAAGGFFAGRCRRVFRAVTYRE